ncbi:hypothetical protein SAMD00079811_03630 [Scytonema sp. HK-05]|uniref:hypothetical protein n=1 Tax=Scytonema sp. HK-05 TaxID=1137095 RepID=UPI000937A83D|nr:hypothetical protein [Scytonema sp. HK-05]OKH55353.1 hypothetical protein NIES2130_26890 [Scytonema sp. HK-05]BAY42785.1 hypothetical protein SAMD00079811_03630 [Scytonema sp. HK-05]
MRLRFATEDDVEQMLSIKSQLILPATATDMNRGGFIEESNREEYLFFIQQAYVLVLEDLRLNAPVGFTIGIPNETLHRTPLWDMRKSVQWNDPTAEKILESKVSYCEQIAVLPSKAYKLYAPALALAMAKILFDQHQFILAGLVHKPMENLASKSLLEWLGGRKIGEIEQEHSSMGQFSRAIYCIEESIFRLKFEDPGQRSRLAVKVQHMIDNLTQKSEKG